MSKQTAEEVLNKVAEDCFKATADEVFPDGQPEWILKAMESYHAQQREELEEEVRKIRDVVDGAIDSQQTEGKHVPDWFKGQMKALEYVLQLITNPKDNE